MGSLAYQRMNSKAQKQRIDDWENEQESVDRYVLGRGTHSKAKITYLETGSSYNVDNYHEVVKYGDRTDESAYLAWLSDPQRRTVQMGKVVVETREED